MFIEFHAVARDEEQGPYRQATVFKIFTEVNGKRNQYTEVIQNEALVIEGFLDHFFSAFISKFKSAAAQEKEESGGTASNT